jgi:hypothetical protein
MSSGDDGGVAACAACGAVAAGPCARCGKPLCGDCCVITTGGASPWAVCEACERSGGASLRGRWLVVLGWFIKPMLALLFAYLVLRWLLA